MTDQEALRKQLQAMIEKSGRALRAAREHLEKKDASRDVKTAGEIAESLLTYLQPFV